MENLKIAVFVAVTLAGVGALVWGMAALVRWRQNQWKAAARALATELARGAAATSTIADWTQDAEIFEWSEPGLALVVSGGSEVAGLPGTAAEAPVASGTLRALFEKPLPFEFSIGRGSCELTGDAAFDGNCEVTGDLEKMRALLQDAGLRERVATLIDSYACNVDVSHEGVVVRCYDPAKFREAALTGLELARLLRRCCAT